MIKDIEQILVEYLKFRTDSNGYAVIKVEDFISYIRFQFEQLEQQKEHNHSLKWVFDKYGYRVKCSKCNEVFFEVITNED
ncbi:hypothetical protein K7G42_04045 [Streptococcus parauberis]|uniref:hypothetical protein n=1 Tax=Streptococcus parauberis TaxID=1348 RepID=UPI000561114A|nr:hypothetical protein [Streptococcus parauberis]WEM65804.1 hypothetical protein P1T45_04125 [Streptococcus parauberis]WOF47684.1 hypothetical protein K7G42_04045 [Streptococcus parauberis]